MRIRLTVTDTEGSADVQTYVFDQSSVTLGRAPGNDLVLPDTSSVVSKRHAQIGVDGDRLTVRDLGSKNYTFVDGDRIAAEAVYGLAPGSVVSIGGFRIEAALERSAAPAPASLDQTVFAPTFVNPFREDAEALADVVGRLRRRFHEGGMTRADEALFEALGDALGPGGDAAWLSAGVRGDLPPPTPPPPPAYEPPAYEPPAYEPPPYTPPPPAAYEPPAFSPPPAPPQPRGIPDYYASAAPASDDETSEDTMGGFAGGGFDPYVPPPAASTPPPPAPPPAAPPPAAPPPYVPSAAAPAPGAMGSGSDHAFDTLVRAVARLVSIPGQFRHEFIGHTVIHTPETAFLFDGDPAALRAHLARPGDQNARLDALLDAANAVAVHHVAMLEGYRAAAREGATALLDAVDPDSGSEGASEGGGALDRLLPGSKDRALLETVRERIAALRADAYSTVERRHFRPAFIQAYLDRSSQPVSEGSGSGRRGY